MAQIELPPTEEVQEVMKSFTPEHWATLHLLFAVFVQIKKEEGIKGVNPTTIRDYLCRATDVVRGFVDREREQARLIYIFEANQCLFDELQEAFDDSTEHIRRIHGFFDYMLRKIILQCDNILGGKKFLKNFKDIFFTKAGFPSSPKASIIVHGLIKEMPGFDDEEDDDNMGNDDSDTLTLDEDSLKQDGFEDAEDDIEEPYDGRHPYIKDWEKLKPLLFGLPYDKALIFHAIALYLCRRFLKRDFCPKYHKAVVKAFVTFKGSSTTKQQTQTLSYANDSFINLKEEVLDYIFNGRDYRAVALKNDLFTLSTDLCLSFVQDSVTQEKAQQLLQNVRVFKDGIQIGSEMESYAFSLYLSANGQYVDLYGKKIEDVRLGDDWTDYEEDDYKGFNDPYGFYGSEEYEYDDDEEQEEDPKEEPSAKLSEYERLLEENNKRIQEYMKEVAKVINKFDLDKDILMHCLNIRMMETVVNPRIYSKYYRAVRKLLSDYQAGMDPSPISDARKEADELFLSRYNFILSEEDVTVRNGKINDFALLSSAFPICIISIGKMSKEHVSQIMGSLSFSENLKTYIGPKIEELAANYLDSARKDILSDQERP